MFKRIIIATVVLAFVVPIAFGQTRYARSQATPTPTPTPGATPIQNRRTVPQRTMQVPQSSPLPRNPATTPMRSNYAAQPAQVQSKQYSTPTPTPATARSQRTMPQRVMPQSSPLPRSNYAAVPAQGQKPYPTPTPTPATASFQNRRTMQAPTQSSTQQRNPAATTMRPNYAAVPAQGQQKQYPAPTPTPVTTRSQRTMPTQSSTLPRNPSTTTMRPNYAAVPAQRQQMPAPAPVPVKPTPPPVPPPDVKAYLDRQLANSQDKKFHMTANGKDLPLTPFHFWPQKSTGPNSTSTSISMRSDDGRVYDLEFVTTGAQVTGIRVSRINGEPVR